MTAEKLIKENTRFDRGGEPLEVIIPYGQFIDFIEEHGLDLSHEEKQEIHAAREDRQAGNTDAFMSLVDFEKTL